MSDLREEVIRALCSVRVPVTGDGLLYADDEGKMPLYSEGEPEVEALADALVGALAGFHLVVPTAYWEYGVEPAPGESIAWGMPVALADGRPTYRRRKYTYPTTYGPPERWPAQEGDTP